MRRIEIDKVWYFFSNSLPYLRVTVVYVVVSLIAGFAIGALIAKCRMSKYKLWKVIGTLYITVTRCTPALVLLFLVYYGLPAICSGTIGDEMNNWPKLVFVCITFSIYIGAASSEIIRSAYQAIDRGQTEAGLSVGLSRFQTFILIIFPQMFRLSIPNIGNMVIYLFKEGTLGYTIGLYDVLGQAYYLNSKLMGAYSVSMYVALTIIYWGLSVMLEKLFGMFEKLFTPETKHSMQCLNVNGGET